ncbi:hypothetical protein GOBAR_AA02154 [Gossypium barbadense]|uniref:Uncharacterized protein n=1 Tax=Gossypium barbadense TaxID=3634 RepID=A0A2P5YS48_GOSBA|nr:hypothetical protein GOBAR_AA02154 [Gossypium barbadense]
MTLRPGFVKLMKHLSKHHPNSQEKEKESWEAASLAFKTKLEVAESNCIRAEIEAAKMRNTYSLPLCHRDMKELRMGQVSKVVEVEGLEIYCSICKDTAKDLSLSNTGGSESCGVFGKSAAKGQDLKRHLWEKCR